jgi:hypothetical protein
MVGGQIGDVTSLATIGVKTPRRTFVPECADVVNTPMRRAERSVTPPIVRRPGELAGPR